MGSRDVRRGLADSPSIRTNAFSRAFGVRWLLERVQARLDLLGVSGDHGVDEVVLGLEVVVDVADRHVGGVGDVRERRALDSLS